jgi:3'-phosphoadenosine 5'-phosphosulfate sulfotransferase (PAPS reductase)/FAD synthetase
MNSDSGRYLLVGNGGNGTIALLQWALTQTFTHIEFVSIATGFCDRAWEERMQTIHAYASQHEIHEQRLSAQPLPLWIRKKNSFPSKKFPWCAQVLKGLVINDYLDQIDPSGNVTVVLAKRQADSRASQQLTEWRDRNPYFGDRRVWLPLWQLTDSDCQRAVSDAGFSWLPHRSLECDPCTYNTEQDFARLPDEALARTAALEQELGVNMFGQPLPEIVQQARAVLPKMTETAHSLNQFDMGCGAPYGCGI